MMAELKHLAATMYKLVFILMIKPLFLFFKPNLFCSLRFSKCLAVLYSCLLILVNSCFQCDYGFLLESSFKTKNQAAIHLELRYFYDFLSFLAPSYLLMWHLNTTWAPLRSRYRKLFFMKDQYLRVCLYDYVYGCRDYSNDGMVQKRLGD